MLVGPTASGKSAVALSLAGLAGGEIVNIDSRQVYKGLYAGTSMPSQPDREKVPHHLYDFLDPTVSYSAGDYCRDAVPVLKEIQARKKNILLVGGTGLYVKALFEGLSDLPVRDDKIREVLLGLAARQGRKALHERLHAVDPVSAGKIPYQNIQRVLRALEVYQITGKPLSELHALAPRKKASFPARFAGLLWETGALKQRIAERCARIAEPILKEAEKLLAQGLAADAPAFQSLGYRSAIDRLDGKISTEEFRRRLTQDTLQYAKRQRTWFKKDPKILWLPVREPFHPQTLAGQIFKELI